jgi:hypothetical protein
LYDHQTGKRQKLRKTSKSDKCEACRQALWKEEPAEATEPKKRQRRRREEDEAELYKNSLGVEGLTLLRSSAAEELYWLQEDLLVEHFLRPYHCSSTNTPELKLRAVLPGDGTAEVRFERAQPACA